MIKKLLKKRDHENHQIAKIDENRRDFLDNQKAKPRKLPSFDKYPLLIGRSAAYDPKAWAPFRASSVFRAVPTEFTSKTTTDICRSVYLLSLGEIASSA